MKNISDEELTREDKCPNCGRDDAYAYGYCGHCGFDVYAYRRNELSKTLMHKKRKAIVYTVLLTIVITASITLSAFNYITNIILRCISGFLASWYIGQQIGKFYNWMSE